MWNENRVARNLANDPSCSLCWQVRESRDHILQTCPSVKDVWTRLLSPAVASQFFKCVGSVGTGEVLESSLESSCLNLEMALELGSRILRILWEFCSITVAELWGIFHGTGTAWRKGIPNIIIESDSSTAAEIVLNGVKNRHPEFYFIDAIQRALRRDCCWSLVHVSKERKFVADWLVKSSLSVMGMCVCSINLHKMSSISLRLGT
ncbi:hypothetical protein J1N35_023983 [Gossypium stocksii]|uniref:RNase H type-1 domain-containing protein n=1 Tax=Gossypium stocksii TaxID=47602 RepID=A0A9D3VL00_9ROSI|nr:hypothetical protein J1N35_023983 [Gossypium stocksii]